MVAVLEDVNMPLRPQSLQMEMNLEDFHFCKVLVPTDPVQRLWRVRHKVPSTK